MVNLLQLFKNDGTTQINPMKVKGENNCRVKFRNLPHDDHFHFRVEYKHETVVLYYYDFTNEEYQSCT